MVNFTEVIESELKPRYRSKGFRIHEFKDKSDLTILGGLIYSYKSGIFHNVYVFDFKSLYPSVIRTFNISHETLNPNGEINSITGKRFSNIPGVIPKYISELIVKRLEATKKENADFYKLTANAIYGNLANPKSILYCRDMAATITQTGRTLNKFVQDLLTSRGYIIICGHTDSVIFYADEDINEKEIEDFLNVKIKEYIMSFGVTENFIRIVFERKYKILYNQAISKRAGILENGELSICGFECDSNKYCKFATDFQRQVLRMVLAGDKHIPEFVKDIKEKVLSGRIDYDDLIIKVKASRDCDDYSGPGFQTILAKKSGCERGDEIRYVVGDFQRKTIYFSRNCIGGYKGYDTKYYWENHISKPVERILETLGIGINQTKMNAFCLGSLISGENVIT